MGLWYPRGPHLQVDFVNAHESQCQSAHQPCGQGPTHLNSSGSSTAAELTLGYGMSGRYLPKEHAGKQGAQILLETSQSCHEPVASLLVWTSEGT